MFLKEISSNPNRDVNAFLMVGFVIYSLSFCQKITHGISTAKNIRF